MDDTSLVILDVEMPERNGIETAEWIRQFEKKKHKRNVLIIGMTGHDDEETKQACIQSGMNQVLTKPISRNTVLEVLKKVQY